MLLGTHPRFCRRFSSGCRGKKGDGDPIRRNHVRPEVPAFKKSKGDPGSSKNPPESLLEADWSAAQISQADWKVRPRSNPPPR